jgi:hypothetical protein
MYISIVANVRLLDLFNQALKQAPNPGDQEKIFAVKRGSDPEIGAAR